VETKTRLFDIQDTLMTIDRKRRLVPRLAEKDFGWRAELVGVVFVFPEMSTHRHVVSRHAATFGAALPARQVEVRQWLTQPTGGLRGIWFLPISHGDDIGQRSRRRRASRSRSEARSVPGKRPERPKSRSLGANATDCGRPDRQPRVIDEPASPRPGRM
jgi:hypothetical protein